MTKGEWRRAIVAACTEAGTYRGIYDHAIDTVSDILAKRDRAQEQYNETGANPLGMHTNKAGARNIVVNPALEVILKLDDHALPYLRDLGLTPAGMKKLTGDITDKQGEGGLEVLLARLEE